LLFLALAAISTIFGHTLPNRSLRYLPVAFVGPSMLGEPVGASILAYFLLSEVLSAGMLVGGAMVMAGTFLTAGKFAPTDGRKPDR
jgi:drug/metabolite transporter (DMT)-like permease